MSKNKWKKDFSKLRLMRRVDEDAFVAKLKELGWDDMPYARDPHTDEIQAIQDKMNLIREKKKKPIVLIDSRMWLPPWGDMVSGEFTKPARPL